MIKIEPVIPGFQDYLRDESHLQGSAEEICFPESEEEICEAFAYAREQGKKVTIQGSRTGLMGGSVPQGGLILNLSHMDKLELFREQNDGSGLIFAQAGVTLEQLQKKIYPWIFMPNPTETGASLGGMFATNAGGLREACFSSCVESLTWVTAGGKIWEIQRGRYVSRGRTLKLPEGICIPCPGKTDLIDFLAGSEGKYGAAASFTLKLQKQEEEVWGILLFFEIQNQAGAFFRKLLDFEKNSSCTKLLGAEFLDRGALNFLGQHGDHRLLKNLNPMPGQTVIYLELGGNPETMGETLAEVLDLFEACGGKEEQTWAENHPAGVEKLSSIRHSLVTILGELPEICGPDGLRWEADIRCPREQLPIFAAGCQALLQKSHIPGAIYGHLLRGSFHVVFLPETEEQRADCGKLLEEISAFVDSGGGSLCGEYGMGKIGPRRFETLLRERLCTRAQAHRFLDPRNLLGN